MNFTVLLLICFSFWTSAIMTAKVSMFSSTVVWECVFSWVLFIFNHISMTWYFMHLSFLAELIIFPLCKSLFLEVCWSNMRIGTTTCFWLPCASSIFPFHFQSPRLYQSTCYRPCYHYNLIPLVHMSELENLILLHSSLSCLGNNLFVSFCWCFCFFSVSFIPPLKFCGFSVVASLYFTFSFMCSPNEL